MSDECTCPQCAATVIRFPVVPDARDRWALYGSQLVDGRRPFGDVGAHYRLPATSSVVLESKEHLLEDKSP